MKITKPIRPDQVQKKQIDIPGSVLACVNKLIEEKWDGTKARFLQKDLLEMILAEDKSLTREEIFDKHLLDFEDMYEEVGWKVTYDKPGYNENYKASFEFSKKGH